MRKVREESNERLLRPDASGTGWGCHLILFAALGFALGPAARAYAQRPQAGEYEVKAAFLYNFTKFVRWPPEVFGGHPNVITVGVLGDNPLGGALRSLEGKVVKGRKLIVLPFKTVQEVEPCHVLFIRVSEKNRLSQALKAVGDSSVLTVGEMKGFTEQGGIINFHVKTSRVGFEINVKAAEQARLKISSKLLKLATLTEEKSGP